MKHLTAVLAFTLTISLTALPAFAQPQKQEGVTGVWKCVAKTESRPNMEFKLDLVQKGKEVTGTASRSDGSTGIQKGSFENGKLKLVVEADGGTYEFEGSLSGDKLTGNLAHSTGTKASWEGVREGAAAPAASAGIEGRWTLRARVGERTAEYVMEFKKDGDQLTGKLTLPDGQSVPMSKASFVDNVLKFSLATGDGSYESEAKLEGDKLVGTYTTPAGQKGDWEATRL